MLRNSSSSPSSFLLKSLYKRGSRASISHPNFSFRLSSVWGGERRRIRNPHENLAIFNSNARRGLFFRLNFHVILDDFLWNHAVAVVLLVSPSFCCFCFVVISSRHVAVANSFSSMCHSHAVWRSFSRCLFLDSFQRDMPAVFESDRQVLLWTF